MRKAKILLESLTEKFPPGPGQHHALILGDNGVYPLNIVLFLGDQYRIIHLEEYDLDCSPVEVVCEVERIMEQES